MNDPVENSNVHGEPNPVGDQPNVDTSNSAVLNHESIDTSSLITRLRADAEVAEKSRIEIEEVLAQIKEANSSLPQQLEHARLLIEQVNALYGTLQTNSTQAESLKSQANDAFQSLQTTVSSATEKVHEVDAIRTNAEQAQAEIATKSAFIEDGRLHAERTRGEIDRHVAEARQSSTNAEEQHQSSRTINDNLNVLHTSAQAVKTQTEANAESVSRLLHQCEENATITKKLADIAEATERKVATYEGRLAELEKIAADRLKTIDALLPSAASAGLASAFNQRRRHFEWPQRGWQCVFVVCVLALIGIAGLEFGFFSQVTQDVTWDKLGLSLLHRLPYALPLIWLAVHASGKAAMAQRVEEDYAFKETVSRSFEGFRREMAELEGKAAPDSALSRLCSGVLTIITNPPGRIYETQSLNQTPLKLVVDSAGPIANAASKLTTATLKIE